MSIRQPIFALIALLILPVLGYFVVDRIQFLSRSERVDGYVSVVTAQNSSCKGSGKRASRYSCTQFSARVPFAPLSGGKPGQLSLSAGSSRGHNQPTTLAGYKPGQKVPVVYDPKDISIAYEDSFFGVWGLPFFVFIFQIAAALGSFAQGRTRHSFRA